MIRIATEMEHAVASWLMNENAIEKWWSRARRLQADLPEYWLLMALIAEAALLCAGNYADNCEYEAAGDLLLNPREILVHRLCDGSSTVKNLHGRLSEQFGLEGVGCHRSMQRFAADLCLEITKPPLLPHMAQMLKESSCISRSFIHRMEAGQRRIADALAFLAAWRIFDSAELWRRLGTSSPHEKAFAVSHLCRFDARVFHRIGMDLRRSLIEPEYRSPFLAGPMWVRAIRIS